MRQGIPMFFLKLAAGVALSTLFWIGLQAHAATAAGAPVVVKDQGYVPFADAPIGYRSQNLSDPVAKLQQQLDSGQVRLEYEPEHGYLKSVLRALRISATSQTLVYSKTSFQYQRISPEHPRALYYNDDVYVGQVHEGRLLEFVSFDPMQGAIFYVMDEHKVDRPRFERSLLDCIQCHVASSTRNVPGVMLRSIFTTPSGTQEPRTAQYITGQESPIQDRWGGWYVTGNTGLAASMGREIPGSVDAFAYLTPYSDVVAHLVLAHQTQMHNAITQTNYQTRLALYGLPPGIIPEFARTRFEKPAEQLVRYLLFANEARLDAPVAGTSGFAEEFAARGPRDPLGRSLRDFDLRKRIFKYPCSYLIYSEAFDAIPGPAKDYIYRRLFDILTGREQGPEFAALSGEDRRAILEILVATKPGLPEEFRQFAGGRNEAELNQKPTERK